MIQSLMLRASATAVGRVEVSLVRLAGRAGWRARAARCSFFVGCDDCVGCAIIFPPSCLFALHMVHAGSRWFTLVHAGSRWFTLVHAGSRWFTLVHAGSRWFTLWRRLSPAFRARHSPPCAPYARGAVRRPPPAWSAGSLRIPPTHLIRPRSRTPRHAP